MKIDHFIQSELKVIASENLDISNDLNATQTKNINELLYNNEKEENINNNTKEEN